MATSAGTVPSSSSYTPIRRMFRSSVPRRSAEVAINEAVLLAKRYATEDAARLVNGILGRIRREAS